MGTVIRLSDSEFEFRNKLNCQSFAILERG
jgi:hypothetical protein